MMAWVLCGVWCVVCGWRVREEKDEKEQIEGQNPKRKKNVERKMKGKEEIRDKRVRELCVGVEEARRRRRRRRRMVNEKKNGSAIPKWKEKQLKINK